MAFTGGSNTTDAYFWKSLSTNSSIDRGYNIYDPYWEYYNLSSLPPVIRVDNQDKAAAPAKREIPPRFDLVGQGQGDVLPQDV